MYHTGNQLQTQTMQPSNRANWAQPPQNIHMSAGKPHNYGSGLEPNDENIQSGVDIVNLDV